MEAADEIRNEILEGSSVRGIIYSRGDGAVDGIFGSPGIDEQRVAGWLDVSAGALSAMAWSAVHVDPLEVAILVYPTATLIVGSLPTGRRIAVVAGEEASLGLLLNQVRRLIREEAS